MVGRRCRRELRRFRRATIEIAQKVYIVGGGACLYQAMSGDGTDQIDGATGAGVPESDGNLDDNEAKNVKLADMPKELWANTGGFYYIMDGFGHPLRYVKSAATHKARQSGAR